jgi:hypothetical protein
MNTFQRRFPIVVALGAIGGAIYHVCAETPAPPAIAEVAKPALSPASTLPPSDRYAGNAGAAS